MLFFGEILRTYEMNDTIVHACFATQSKTCTTQNVKYCLNLMKQLENDIFSNNAAPLFESDWEICLKLLEPGDDLPRYLRTKNKNK